MNTVVTSLPLGAVAPGLASAGAGLRIRFARVGFAVWNALEAVGRARAQTHLLEFANRCEAQQPELAKELRAACHQGPMA